MSTSDAFAYLGGRWARDPVEVSHDLAVLDGRGTWAVLIDFDGAATCVRFATVEASPWASDEVWPGVSTAAWHSSMSEAEYVNAVEQVRDQIARGEVYQVNVCRRLTTDEAVERRPRALLDLVLSGHPAPFAGALHLPELGISAVSASPELYLGRDGATVTSRPIKGTAAPGVAFLAKDRAENVMIVDLVRHDLGAVARTGSVEVAQLCAREEHPGLSHLVSTVRAELADGTTWQSLIDASFPPGSVTGAPKSSALRFIEQLEPVERGPYCGAIGWVDADHGTAELAVGIRTFWWDADDRLNLGTGAGITWASDARTEWQETELKARQLLALLER
jgi:para-aminobenzoate synthetase component 1